MIPTVTEEKRCVRCNTKLNHFANTDYCPNCGQLGVKRQSNACPNHCHAPVVNIPGAGKRCQQCGAQWG